MKIFRFAKEHSSVIGRLVVNQIGMAIFGLVLTAAASAAGESKRIFLLFCSIFAAVFYMFLLYSAMWEQGARARVRIDGGRLTRDRLFGLKAALWANALNILLELLMLIGWLFGFVLTHADFAVSLHAVVQMIACLTQAMYIGIFRYIYPPVSGTTVAAYAPAAAANCLAFFLMLLPGLIVCTLAYIMGLYGFKIKYLFGGSRHEPYKNDKNGKDA